MALPIEDRILFEDNHLIIVNKLPGELSQKDKTGDDSLLETISVFIKARDEKPGNVYLGLVHRLDRPTSGILIFAKTSKALSRMNEIFKERTIRKIYYAITDSLLPNESGTLTHYLVRNEKKNMSKAFLKEIPQSQLAILHYNLVGKGTNYNAYTIDLETGRHHQIRAQLQACDVHIKGDLKYGSKRSNKDGGISLHAGEISFPHPVKETLVHIQAPPTKVQESLWEVFEFPPLLSVERSS